MKIKKSKTYDIEKSDIIVKVLNIVYENDEMWKAKCAIMHKRHGFIYELKYLRLFKDKIQHWRIFNER